MKKRTMLVLLMAIAYVVNLYGFAMMVQDLWEHNVRLAILSFATQQIAQCLGNNLGELLSEPETPKTE